MTLQPLDRYPGLDAQFSSPTFSPSGCNGIGPLFRNWRRPPKFKKAVRTEADVDALKVINPEQDLPYVVNAVKTIRRELNGRVPLIGFSGSPWTLATYMIEGGSSRDFRRAKEMLYNQPQVLHRLLDVLADSVTVYLNAQITAGAQAVQFLIPGAVHSPMRPIRSFRSNTCRKSSAA